MKYYFCKYIPPRGDFLATMTPQESEWMKQHGVFLNDLTAQGKIVAHGPVIDSTGGFGLSLYQLDDDEDIESIISEDPLVKNGAGRMEYYSMLHLTTRA